MRNVMIKAWEIARKGQEKFGGKVKEYFAQALRMAWAIAKKGMEKVEMGLQKLPGKNGACFFVVNDVDGLEVNLLTEKKNVYSGEMVTQRTPVREYRKGANKVTGQEIRLYQYAWNCGDIEIRLGDQVIVIDNHIDKKWF